MNSRRKACYGGQAVSNLFSQRKTRLSIPYTDFQQIRGVDLAGNATHALGLRCLSLFWSSVLFATRTIINSTNENPCPVFSCEIACSFVSFVPYSRIPQELLGIHQNSSPRECSSSQSFQYVLDDIIKKLKEIRVTLDHSNPHEAAQPGGQKSQL